MRDRLTVTISGSTNDKGQRMYRAMQSGQPLMADTQDRQIAYNVAEAAYARLGTAHKVFTEWDGDLGTEKVLFEDMGGFPLRHRVGNGTAMYAGASQAARRR